MFSHSATVVLTEVLFVIRLKKHDGMSYCSNIRDKTRLMQYIFETVLAKPGCRDLIRKVVCGFHSLLDTEITDSAVRGIFSLQCVSARLSVRLRVCGQRGDSISSQCPFH